MCNIAIPQSILSEKSAERNACTHAQYSKRSDMCAPLSRLNVESSPVQSTAEYRQWTFARSALLSAGWSGAQRECGAHKHMLPAPPSHFDSIHSRNGATGADSSSARVATHKTNGHHEPVVHTRHEKENNTGESNTKICAHTVEHTRWGAHTHTAHQPTHTYRYLEIFGEHRWKSACCFSFHLLGSVWLYRMTEKSLTVIIYFQ